MPRVNRCACGAVAFGGAVNGAHFCRPLRRAALTAGLLSRGFVPGPLAGTVSVTTGAHKGVPLDPESALAEALDCREK